MITIGKLREFGADVDEALKRCMNNEAFYLRLVEKAALDPSFDRLKEAVDAGDLEKGFELAHALKGTMGNLSLTPIFRPVVEITEHLRGREQMDYTPCLNEILGRRDDLVALLR